MYILGSPKVPPAETVSRLKSETQTPEGGFQVVIAFATACFEATRLLPLHIQSAGIISYVAFLNGVI